MTMKEDVYNKLKNIADEFIKYIEIPLNIVDIEVVGSNASYNYNENSDIDLHIIVNNEVNYVDPEILRMLYNSKKNSFNDNYDLDIDGIPVEVYIEDVSDGNATNGRFSVRDNQWVVKPEPIHYEIPDIADTLTEYVNKCNEALQSTNAQDILDLVNEIYMMRKLGLAEEGEASVGNLVFKELRNMDMIPKLKEHYYELRSEQLTEVKECSKQNLEEASLSRLFQHTKDKDTFAVIGSQDQDTKKSRFSELKSLVGNLRNKIQNIGYNYLEGTYTYADGEQGIEDSLIVYNIPKDDALDIANKLNQESIIWKDDNYFGFINADGTESGTFDKGDLTFDQQITNMYGSRLRSGNGLKPAFAFECKLIETDTTGSTFSKQHNSKIKDYLVCSISLRNEVLKNALNEDVLIEAKKDTPEVKIFKELLTKLKESNEEKAIDSVEITSYIVENDIVCENVEVSEELQDLGYTRTYDIYINGDIVGYIGYAKNKWVGDLCR